MLESKILLEGLIIRGPVQWQILKPATGVIRPPFSSNHFHRSNERGGTDVDSIRGAVTSPTNHTVHRYRPQRSCGKVIFLLHLSVILFTVEGGGLPKCMLGYTLPGSTHTPLSADTEHSRFH